MKSITHFLRCTVSVLILIFSISVIGEESTMQPTTIFIAGDSTAANYDDPIQQGWGGVLAQYFDSDSVAIDNRAQAGRSSRTFIREGWWDSLHKDIKPGDLVFIQFGHNDGTPINDATRARGTLPGIGDNFVDIANELTEKEERVYSFGYYIRKMIADVRAKGAHPVLMSLTVRNIWQNGKIERGSGNYGYWSYQLALELDTPFIDVTNAAADALEAMGEAKTAALYPKDHTHFNPEGAQLYASIIVSALKGMRPSLPETFYSQTGTLVDAYPWTFVRLPFVENPDNRSIFMVGDSTVRNGRGDGENGEWGWGDFVAQHFSEHKLNFVNRAVGGLSSRTFITGGHWQRALNLMKPGDIVLIQFGHNDAGALNDDSRARGTIKGVTDEYVDIRNMLTGQDERVYSYGWYLRKMIGEAKAKGIIPIVCSPVPRKKWNEDNALIATAENSYPLWAETVARQSGTMFIDLHNLVASEYNHLGASAVDKLFADKHTHTSAEGAALNGKIVAQKLTQILGN